MANEGRRDGSRTTALRFWCPDRRSLVRSGSGCWRYIPSDGGDDLRRPATTTRPDSGSRARWSDRLAFRPLLGWATAWSFDRLRLWLEQGIRRRFRSGSSSPARSEPSCRRSPLPTRPATSPAARRLDRRRRRSVRRSSYRAAAMARLEIRPFSRRVRRRRRESCSPPAIARIGQPSRSCRRSTRTRRRRRRRSRRCSPQTASPARSRSAKGESVGYLLGRTAAEPDLGRARLGRARRATRSRSRRTCAISTAPRPRRLGGGGPTCATTRCVPAHDAALLRAWSRVGFGQQHALGVREVPDGRVAGGRAARRGAATSTRWSR